MMSEDRERTVGRAGVRISERLNDLLVEKVKGVRGPLWVEPIAGGRSNPTYLPSGDNQHYVLRSRPRGDLLPSAHRIDREAKVLRALAETDVPVPRVLLVVDEPEPFGAPFYIMEWVPGIVIEDPALSDLTAGRRAPSYRNAIDILAALHRLDHIACGLADFAVPGDYNARQRKRWSAQLELSGGAPPAMALLADRLSNAIPEHQIPCLIHGDYRFGDFLLEAGDGRIAAVLDWELSTIGDPFSDLAYFVLAFDVPRKGQILPGLHGIDLADHQLPTPSALIERYCRAVGATLPDSSPAHRASSFYRLAAISHGVFHRRSFGRGLASNETAQIEELAEIGLFPRSVAPVRKRTSLHELRTFQRRQSARRSCPDIHGG